MERNADMVITKHRALFGMPGELKELVKLPMKRAKSSPVQDCLLVAPLAQIDDIVCLIHEMITSKDASSSDETMQQRLAKLLQAMPRSSISELLSMVRDFDATESGSNSCLTKQLSALLLKSSEEM